MRPFTPFSSDRLWEMLGNQNDIDNVHWEHSMDVETNLFLNQETPEPLFSRLELDEILERENSLIDSKDNDESLPPNDGGGYIDFEDFMKVEMRTGRIVSVETTPMRTNSS